MRILSDSFEPLQSQLTNEWNTLSTSMKSYYSRKAQECVDLILSIIAPGQETFLLDSIQKKFTRNSEKLELDSVTKSVIDAYNKVTDSRTQTQILSVIVNNFTKTDLQKLIPGLTVFKIDSARKHALVKGPGHLLHQPKIYRVKLTKPKVIHFIEFLLNPLYSSIVGFGQTVLKLSSNEKMQIPKVIRNVIHSRIIDAYQSYCKENGFETFSRASLYRILKVCNASKQKALQGLDNITAAGMNSIGTLIKLTSKLETFGMNSTDVISLTNILQLVNQFLKYEYKTHLNRLDGCTDHCTIFALSDTNDNFSSTCDHTHEQNCDKCSMVDSCADLIRRKFSQMDIPEAVMDEINYEIDISERNLTEWKKHLLRTVHQDNARSNILKTLTAKKALVIMDWAMKFLPFQFRETQSEFFGKKGFSWHISCVITKSDDNELDLQCYVHILEMGSQGWFSVANILLHLLHHLKDVKPQIEEISLKSDNAACYHCTNLVSFIQLNNTSFPIYVKEYNFSETQSGKDLCDSKTGSSRLHMYKYANEGHNIISTTDMKKALESYGGVRGTQVCIISIDQEEEPKTKVKIPGISMLNNFSFGANGMTVRRAYNVGEGQLIKNINEQQLLNSSVYRLKVLEPFPGINNQPKSGKVAAHSAENIEDNSVLETLPETVSEDDCNLDERTPQAPFYCCPDDSCDKVFVKSTNLEKHLTLGNHSYRSNQISGLDSAVEIYASQCESLRDYQNSLFRRETDICDTNSTDSLRESTQQTKNKGWALKGKRVTTRFSENVKLYLKNICISSDKTGSRPDYQSLSEELRKATDENGQKLFQKDEWLNPTQIRGYVAQFLSKSKAKMATAPKQSRVELQEVSVEDDEKLSEVVNMLDVNEYNNYVSTMVNEVLSAVAM
ncbi:uncharacterized protein LOC134262593 [Saccostrea cucullata]|uniref:uncharacterized protein LOC134262593 n=1 Tax=Saccostrea cuccullata TaxID=36930 RepID=UPI002ED12CB8